MATWEYVHHRWYVPEEQAVDRSMSEQLDEYGADGWELVSVAVHTDITWESPRWTKFAGTYSAGAFFHAFFKRQTD